MTDDNAWDKEVSTFRSAGVAPIPKDAPPKTEEPAKVEAKADDGADDADAQAAVEGKEKLPTWLEKRVARVNKKEAEADLRVAKAERTAQEALDEVAKLRSEMAAGSKGAGADKAPDPDDFDTTREYDKAMEAWQAKKAAPKVAPKTEPKVEKVEPSAESVAAGKFLASSLTKATEAGIRQLPNLSTETIIAMADIADGDKKEAQKVAAFIVSMPHILAAIEELPPNRREAALAKAYGDADLKPDKVEDKKETQNAPPPIRRVNGRSESPAADDFASFEQERNAEEVKRRGHAY